MTTILATYYAKIQDVPDSEYKVEILEDGPVKKVAVNGKVYELYRNRYRINLCKNSGFR